jgi:hypothetical protein
VGFVCSICGEQHDERLLDIRLGLPDSIHRLDPDDRESRTWLTDDFAVLDNEHFFVRGLLELPIPELANHFGYGTWVEVPMRAFSDLMKRWHEPEQFEPVTGYLANELEPYRGTVGLEARLRAISADRLPAVELAEAPHELVHDQQHGISAGRSDELAAVVKHAA